MKKQYFTVYHIPSGKTVTTKISIKELDNLSSVLYRIYYDNEWDFPPTLEEMRKEVDIELVKD